MKQSQFRSEVIFFNNQAIFFNADRITRQKLISIPVTDQNDLFGFLDEFLSGKVEDDIYIEPYPALKQDLKQYFKMVKAAGGVVKNEKSEYLFIKRFGVWDLPKGKLEEGENFETAALREVEEETGLKGLELVHPVISTYHTYVLKKKRMLKKTRWFEMHYSGKKKPVLESKEGISDYRWARPGETDFIRQNTYKSIMDVLYFKKLI